MMNELQRKLLQMTLEIVDICDRNGILYYLYAGSLIGALRHKGFLPWDDDLDIFMSRKDWNKFLKVTQNGNIPKNRYLVAPETDRSYPNGFARYGDSETTTIHNNEVTWEEGQTGVIIDIFVLDPVPDLGESYERHVRDLELYYDLLNESILYSYRFRWPDGNERYLRYLRRMQTEGRDKVLREIEARLTQYTEEECEYYVLNYAGAVQVYKINEFGSSRWCSFEGHRLRIPDRSSDNLVYHYGDEWFEIPDVSGQETHDAVFSLSTDYKTIRADFSRYIDCKSSRKALLDRKKFLMEAADKRIIYSDMKKKRKALFVAEDTVRRIGSSGIDLYKALKEHKFSELNTLYAYYFQNQFSRELSGRLDFKGSHVFNFPIYCDIGDEYLIPALWLLTMTNRISKADRLITIREKAGRPALKEIDEIKALIAAIRKSISEADVGNTDLAFDIISKVYAEHPDVELGTMQYIRLLIKKGMLAEARTAAGNAQLCFPANYVFRKFIGDCEYIENPDVWSAFTIYGEVVGNTRNGLSLLDIREKADSLGADLIKEISLEKNGDHAALLVQLSPDNADYAALWIDIMTARGNLSLEDLGNFNKLVKKFPQTESVCKAVARAYEQKGYPKTVAKLYCQSLLTDDIDELKAIRKRLEKLASEEKNPYTLKILADIYTRLGQVDKASAINEALRDFKAWLTREDLVSHQENLETDKALIVQKLNETFIKPLDRNSDLDKAGHTDESAKAPSGAALTRYQGVQQRSSLLLQEVAQLCSANGIDYVLGFETMKMAILLKGHAPDSVNLDLMIPAGKMQAFIDAFNREGRKDRALLYPGNNKDYKTFRIVYADTSSSCLKLLTHSKTATGNIHITIIPLRGKTSGNRYRLTRALERRWAGLSIKNAEGLKEKLVTAAANIKLTADGESSNAKCFSLFVRDYDSLSGNLSILRSNGTFFTFNAKNFTSRESAVFEGISYPVLGSPMDMLKKYFGAAKIKKPSFNYKTESLLVSELIPSRDFQKQAEEAGVGQDDIFSYADTIKHYDDQAAVFESAKMRDIYIAKRSGDRLALRESLDAQSYVIDNLLKNHAYPRLLKIFKPCLNKTIFYYNQGLGFAVSKKYLDIVCLLLEYQGKADMVEPLRNMVPSEHLLPLETAGPSGSEAPASKS